MGASGQPQAVWCRSPCCLPLNSPCYPVASILLLMAVVWLDWANAHETSCNNRHISTVSLWGLELVCWGEAGMSGRPWVSWSSLNSPSNGHRMHTWTSASVFPLDNPVSTGTAAQTRMTSSLFVWVLAVCAPGIRCAWSQVWCSRFSYTLLSLIDLPLHVLGQVYVIPGTST